MYHASLLKLFSLILCVVGVLEPGHLELLQDKGDGEEGGVGGEPSSPQSKGTGQAGHSLCSVKQ